MSGEQRRLSGMMVEEVEKYRDSIGTIIREAVREGKVLYERAA